MRYIVDNQATRFPETPWRVMDTQEKYGLMGLFGERKDAEEFAKKLNQSWEEWLEAAKKYGWEE